MKRWFWLLLALALPTQTATAQCSAQPWDNNWGIGTVFRLSVPQSIGGTLSMGNVHINVKDCGAKGDGVTDDTRAIQNAVTYAAANAPPLAGGVVDFPCGSYIMTATLQVPQAINQNAVTLRGTQMRCTTIFFKGATTNFTAAPTTPALLLEGSATPDNAGATANITQFVGIENLTIDGGNLTGAGNVRGVQLTEAQNCWMTNVIIQNLPNSSTGLYLRGSTITTGLGQTATRPETRECNFRNVVVQASIGSGANARPSAVIFQNADENNFFDCVFAVAPGLTSVGNDSIFVVWFQAGRQNRFYGVLISGDVTANKTQYVGEVFGPPQGENGTAQGSVLQNQTYGDWIEGFDIALWNRFDGSGNTNGNAINNVQVAIYNTFFKDSSNVACAGPGGFLSFLVTSPAIGPPDGPVNYLGCTRPPYAASVNLVSGNTTPDVSGGELFFTTNSSPTTITNFLNPKPGQKWTLCTTDANTSIANNANIALQGNSATTLPNGACLHFYYDGKNTFHRIEVSRTQTGTPDGAAALTCGGSTTPAIDASLAAYYTCNITANVAVVLAVPTNSPGAGWSKMITVAFRNSSGGALTTAPTFNTGAGGFKFAAASIVNPTNGTQVLYTWRWDPVQSFWYEVDTPLTTPL